MSSLSQEELLRRVQSYGYQAKIGGSYNCVLVKTCPDCGNTNSNLKLDAESGGYHCWACGEGGRLDEWLKQWCGEDVEIPVRIDDRRRSHAQPGISSSLPSGLVSALEVSRATDYLHSRGLNDNQISRYDISVCTDEDHEHFGRIIVPFTEYWSGKPAGFAARSYLPGSDRRWMTSKIIDRVVGWREGGRSNIHILVEGPMDALRVNQEGFQAASSLGLSRDRAVEEWVAAVPGDDYLVVMLDGDESGRRKSKQWYRLARRFRLDADTKAKVKQIVPPAGKDPADATPSELRNVINQHLSQEASA